MPSKKKPSRADLPEDYDSTDPKYIIIYGWGDIAILLLAPTLIIGAIVWQCLK